MESGNFHDHPHHQLQNQLLGSSPLATPSGYGVGSSHAWIPNTILNPSNFSPNGDGVIIDSRDSRQQNDSSSMIQDLGFQRDNSNKNVRSGSFPNQSSSHDLHLARINGELSDSYKKFSEIIHNSLSSVEDFHLQPTSYMKNDQRDLNHLSEKLLLRNLSSVPAEEFFSGAGSQNSSRGNFSQIFPTINISNLNQSSSSDIFTSDRSFAGCLNQASNDHFGRNKDSFYYGFDHLQQAIHRSSNITTKMLIIFTLCILKISPFGPSGVTGAKRPSSFSETKLPPQTLQKKSRSDSRASCPPIKVRKEKLGDRIAALQQLVAPFGKVGNTSTLGLGANKTKETISLLRTHSLLMNFGQPKILTHDHTVSTL
ncbi:hypothetical protein U1Q18_005854 [Sarracenia purpurea var. burkii]